VNKEDLDERGLCTVVILERGKVAIIGAGAGGKGTKMGIVAKGSLYRACAEGDGNRPGVRRWRVALEGVQSHEPRACDHPENGGPESLDCPLQDDSSFRGGSWSPGKTRSGPMTCSSDKW